MLEYFYSSIEQQCFFISLFAQDRVVAFFIREGALFHSFAVSLLKLIFAAVDFASSFHNIVNCFAFCHRVVLILYFLLDKIVLNPKR